MLFLVFVITILLTMYIADQRSKKVSEYKELLKKSGDYLFSFEDFRLAHSNLSYERALLKFYRDSDRRMVAIEAAKKREAILKERDDKDKQQRIIKRIFAYKYDNFIYSLFSPLAKKELTKDGPKMESEGYLPKDYVLQKIMDEYGLSDSESQELYIQFIDNELLKEEKKPTPSEIRSRYAGLGSYVQTVYERYYGDDLLNKAVTIVYVGYILKLGTTHIVSEQDLDMDKYISQHGPRCTREQLIAEVKQMGL